MWTLTLSLVMMNAMLFWLLLPLIQWLVTNVSPLIFMIVVLLWWNVLIVCLLRAKMTAFAHLSSHDLADSA